MTKFHDGDNRINELIRHVFDTCYSNKERGTMKSVHSEVQMLVKKENQIGGEAKLKVPSLRSLYEWTICRR